MLRATICGWAAASLGLIAVQVNADPPERDMRLLHQMAGCFEVTYRFVEDGEHDSLSPDYGIEAPITEWIGFERTDDDEPLHTHVSMTEDGRLVPHFHEIWRYEPQHGQWRHEVWSRTPDDPDRELRYACHGTWEMNRWECAAGKARKPFRDSGAPFGFEREDYDWLDRTNFVLVTPRGWFHNQHNRKMRDENKLVAYELGWITYKRVERARCGQAPEDFPKLSPTTVGR